MLFILDIWTHAFSTVEIAVCFFLLHRYFLLDFFFNIYLKEQVS